MNLALTGFVRRTVKHDCKDHSLLKFPGDICLSNLLGTHARPNRRTMIPSLHENVRDRSSFPIDIQYPCYARHLLIKIP